MLGVTLRGANGIGDKLQFASFPENYFRNTGKRIVDLDCAWIFDHNPYVVRHEEPETVINLWLLRWVVPGKELADKLLNKTVFFSKEIAEEVLKKPIFSSIAERTATAFGHTVYLRHPRLYRFEDERTINSRVVIHTTGRRGAPLYSPSGVKINLEFSLRHYRSRETQVLRL
jgi:hypothetical protein